MFNNTISDSLFNFTFPFDLPEFKIPNLSFPVQNNLYALYDNFYTLREPNFIIQTKDLVYFIIGLYMLQIMGSIFGKIISRINLSLYTWLFVTKLDCILYFVSGCGVYGEEYTLNDYIHALSFALFIIYIMMESKFINFIFVMSVMIYLKKSEYYMYTNAYIFIAVTTKICSDEYVIYALGIMHIAFLRKVNNFMIRIQQI